VPFPINFDSIFGTWRTFADYNLHHPNDKLAPRRCKPNRQSDSDEHDGKSENRAVER
jgi:hypothetical protein